MKFKTKPFKHQRKVHKEAWMKEFYAYLMEQGTGKSWVVVNSAAELWLHGRIDTILGIAPKGVAPEWIRKQFPEHMPDEVEYVVALWKAKSMMTRERQRAIDAVMQEKTKLRIFIMNTEAFGATVDALEFAMDVLGTTRKALVFVDESHRIKTPDASTTKRILKLRKLSAYRRILTGTVAATPFDTFSQFGFLSPDILGTSSFSAFKAEYAEMLPEHSGLLRHIAQRKNIKRVFKGHYQCDDTGDIVDGKYNQDGSERKQYLELEWVPAVLATNKDGTPKFKNLDKLHDLIAPHSFRVLKADCLDLPPKLYNRYFTELTDRQWKLYNEISDKHRIEWEDGRLSIFAKLTVYLRLQQVICGYIPTGEEEGKLHELFKSWGDNPRIESALELLADRPPSEGTIIWCRFIEDIKRLSEALRESYGERSVVQFYGAINEKDRKEAVERFEGERVIMGKGGTVLRREEVQHKDRPRFMVAQQRAGGLGQTWVAANLSFHYSNAFGLIDRLQAEDRPHRIGQTRTVNYIDMEAEDTIDSTIITSLIAGKGVADTINGDEKRKWL